MNTEVIPQELQACDQWVCWEYRTRDGKETKVPVRADRGEFASVTDPDTWSSFSAALEATSTSSIDGIGFVFTADDPFVGIDLDDCRDPETMMADEWATDLVSRLNSYSEISPSGTGYHVYVSGELPPGGNRSGQVEMYEDNRFFTVTGKHLSGTPIAVEARQDVLEAVHQEYVAVEPDDAERVGVTEEPTGSSTLSDEEVLRKAMAAANGEKFERLWNGGTGGYESQSEADFALCCLLAFWTNGDGQQMDRLFRESQLVRPKWDERHFANGETYGEKTVKRAIARTSTFYDPSQGDAWEDEERDAVRKTDSSMVCRGADQGGFMGETSGSPSVSVDDAFEAIDQVLVEILDQHDRLHDEIEGIHATLTEIQSRLATLDDK